MLDVFPFMFNELKVKLFFKFYNEFITLQYNIK